MISIGSGKNESNFGPNSSKFWIELLNSTQLISKNVSHFPEIKACRLRMAYSKLQNNKVNESRPDFSNFQKTKGSFLLDKESKSSLIKKSEKGDPTGLTIFNQHNTRYRAGRNSSFEGTQLVRTIDVAQIKKLTKTKRSDSSQLNKNGLNKKSQQFSEYFKKVILNQRASNDLSKFFSEGKGVDISDRSHFQKLERMKLSILNRKIQDKEQSFLCVSTKLNKYDNLKKKSQLPTLQKKTNRLQKNENKTSEQRASKQANSFACEPWESDQIQHDIQLH